MSNPALKAHAIAMKLLLTRPVYVAKRLVKMKIDSVIESSFDKASSELDAYGAGFKAGYKHALHEIDLGEHDG